MTATGSNDFRPKVAVLTTTRAEYYQLRPVLTALRASETLALVLLVSGSHLSPQYGRSERDIVADGFEIAERLPILVDEDSGLGAAGTSALAVQAVAGALTRQGANLLLLAGDRYELLAAALAATCVGVPIAHLHGGERTDGAIDDVCRHAITKLSAIHFVSTEVYRHRVLQLGENPGHVFTVGAPFLDQVKSTVLLDAAELEKELGLPLRSPVALVAYHPVTRGEEDDAQVCRWLLDAVAAHCRTIIVTAPNQDAGHSMVIEALQAFTRRHENAALFANLGSRRFLSVMSQAAVMAGNSSSGVHEAASFRLPVVNIGSRQASRLKPRNVIDADPSEPAIRAAVARALSAEFRVQIGDTENPYGDGHAGEKLVAHLEQLAPFERFLKKTFCDSPEVRSSTAQWNTAHE